MDNISSLIKEAKPLYLERKKQKKQTAFILSMFLLMIPIYEVNMVVQKNNILCESESIIEYQGLPTDEYGLLMVEI